jgi:hypothetical protein
LAILGGGLLRRKWRFVDVFPCWSSSLSWLWLLLLLQVLAADIAGCRFRKTLRKWSQANVFCGLFLRLCVCVHECFVGRIWITATLAILFSDFQEV